MSLVPISDGAFVLYMDESQYLRSREVPAAAREFGVAGAMAAFNDGMEILQVDHAMPKTFRTTGGRRQYSREFVKACAGSFSEINALCERLRREIQKAVDDLSQIKEAADRAHAQADDLDNIYDDLFEKRLAACLPQIGRSR